MFLPVKLGLLCGFCDWQNRNKGAPFQALVKGYLAFGCGENGVVAAHANALTRPPLGATLAHDDIARNGRLATKQFHAKTAAVRIATVTG